MRRWEVVEVVMKGKGMKRRRPKPRGRASSPISPIHVPTRRFRALQKKQEL
jgi:hypothetical protein